MAGIEAEVNVVEGQDLGWELIPNELLCMIFQNLDVSSLISCMFVSKKWKMTAEYVANWHNIWKDIIHIGLMNGGRHMIDRTMLSTKDIFENYLLWNVVDKATSQVVNSYYVIDVVSLGVNQEYLIVNNGDDILYYDIDAFRVTREFQTQCMQFKENDYIVARMTGERSDATGFNVTSGELHIFGKELIERSHRYSRDRRTYCMKHIRHFELHGKRCYALTVYNILWSCTYSFQKGWKVELVARFYGGSYDSISVVHPYNDKVYIITKGGEVFVAITAEGGFQKVWEVEMPLNSKVMTLYHECDVVVSVPGKTDSIVMMYNEEKGYTQMICTNLSCAKQYGTVLFLGFKSGKVWVCLPWKMQQNMSDPQPECVFDVNDICEDKIEPTIYYIDVCERKRSHVLFIATHGHVFQILFTYPQTNDELFDFKGGFSFMYETVIKQNETSIVAEESLLHFQLAAPCSFIHSDPV